MAQGDMGSTIWSKHERLEKYNGTLTEQLRSLLRAFDCDINIPINTYTYKDGEAVVKYRVLIIIPKELTQHLTMPHWEGRSYTAAYQEALVQAIATIRECKAAQLIGTSFAAILHDSLPSELALDHSVLVKNKPGLATRLLDRYRQLVGSMYNTHQVIVKDKGSMLKDLTDPNWERFPGKEKAQEVGGTHCIPAEGTSR